MSLLMLSGISKDCQLEGFILSFLHTPVGLAQELPKLLTRLIYIYIYIYTNINIYIYIPKITTKYPEIIYQNIQIVTN